MVHFWRINRVESEPHVPVFFVWYSAMEQIHQSCFNYLVNKGFRRPGWVQISHQFSDPCSTLKHIYFVVSFVFSPLTLFCMTNLCRFINSVNTHLRFLKFNSDTATKTTSGILSSRKIVLNPHTRILRDLKTGIIPTYGNLRSQDSCYTHTGQSAISYTHPTLKQAISLTLFFIPTHQPHLHDNPPPSY